MTLRTAEYQTSRVSNIFRIEIDLIEHYRENTENLINTVRFSWMPRVYLAPWGAGNDHS